MKKKIWLGTLKKRIRLITLLTLATAASFLLWKFAPWAELSDKYSEFSISDLPAIWYYASIFLLAVLLMALIYRWLIVIPENQARALQKPESPIVIGEQKVSAAAFTYTQQSAVKPTELFSIENEARKTLSQIIGGFLVIVGLLFTGANLAITQREAEKNRSLALEGQITDRFTKAITQLGDDKLEVRLGGIYALERIAKDSEKDHWTIMEVLTAYVRQHRPKKAKNYAVKPLQNRKTDNAEQREVAELPTDVQAILTVIGRRKISKERDKGFLNFVETDLSQVTLYDAQLFRADLVGANLVGADLEFANLSGANLHEANLHEANLHEANLSGANLSGANLHEANLHEANLYGANLSRANLVGADLGFAFLEKADLRGADLRGIDLSDVIVLTWKQVSQAIIDDLTTLPNEIENTHKDELRAMREKTKKEREGK